MSSFSPELILERLITTWNAISLIQLLIPT